MPWKLAFAVRETASRVLTSIQSTGGGSHRDSRCGLMGWSQSEDTPPKPKDVSARRVGRVYPVKAAMPHTIGRARTHMRARVHARQASTSKLWISVLVTGLPARPSNLELMVSLMIGRILRSVERRSLSLN